jgi:hypothetical protein
MKHTERLTPIAAALSALTTLLCCLPLGFAAAAATASLSVAVAALRPWLLGASVVLVAIGFVQVYSGRKSCDRRSGATLAILWMCAAIVLLVTLLPQVLATALADLLPSR